MASRAEQKAAARAQREAKQRELVVARRRRQRLTYLGGILAIAIAAVVVVIVVSSGGGTSAKDATTVSKSTQKTIVSYVNSALAGIPQSGNVLGNPKAPVTITEYGDLVCPICAQFATTSEPQLIADEVKTGKVRLIYRAFETASSYNPSNAKEFVTTQVAARSAGLQHKEWNFVLTTYFEQPSEINGQDAEDAPYVNSAYLQNRAAQVSGLNLAQWQANLVNPKLTAQVNADMAAGTALGVTGTPAIIVSGPKGSPIFYDKNNSSNLSAVPTIQTLQSLIKQVS